MDIRKRLGLKPSTPSTKRQSASRQGWKKKRNPIEGKFGQAKTGYGLNRIKARLKETSESWIAGILLALNLVKLAGAASLTLISKRGLGFSAQMHAVWFNFGRFEYFHTAYGYTLNPQVPNLF